MAKQTIEILWSDKAISDLRNIYEYLCTQISEQSAFDYTKRIVSSAEILQTHPLSGSQEPYLKGLSKTYRRLIYENYKLVYSVNPDIIEIHSVFDVRQNPNKMGV